LERIMKVALKALAVLFVAIAGFLIYAILAAVTSEEGARVGVCLAYAAAVVVLGYLAMRLWRGGGTPQSA
jgi:hypothetical protein